MFWQKGEGAGLRGRAITFTASLLGGEGKRMEILFENKNFSAGKKRNMNTVKIFTVYCPKII